MFSVQEEDVHITESVGDGLRSGASVPPLRCLLSSVGEGRRLFVSLYNIWFFAIILIKKKSLNIKATSITGDT